MILKWLRELDKTWFKVLKSPLGRGLMVNDYE